MQYAKLGKTGYKVSRLGFGAMRLPMTDGRVDRDKAIPMIHRAFELGVTYIDTAVGYCSGDSQVVVGEALKGWRDKVVVSTKNHHYNKADDRPWWKNLEDSLKRLQVDCIDVYNFHGLNWSLFEEHVAGPGGQLEWMRKARDQGMIRHVCFSFHDKPEALVKIAQTGEFEAVTLQYNLLDRSNEPALGACRKAGMGVVVMGPVGGGRLGAPSQAIRSILPGAASVPEVALRFVLANPNVTVALSGMSEMAHVEENARVASKATPLSAAEKRKVQSALRRYRKLSDLYCTGCNYCMPCPAGVDIPENFLALNYLLVYGLEQAARDRYRHMGGRASLCMGCGKCVSKCPQKIDVVGQLRETIRKLDESYGKVVATIVPTKVRGLKGSSGRYDASIKCRMDCRNLSDEQVDARIKFSPASNISVRMPRQLGKLDAWKHRAIELDVKVTSAKAGDSLRLCPALEGKGALVCTGDPIRLAVAAKASARPASALKKAPRVQAKTVSHAKPPRSDAKAQAAGSVQAHFAYDRHGLIAEIEVDGGCHRPAGSDSDRAGWVWLSISPDVPGGSHRKGRYFSFDVSGQVGQAVPVQIHPKQLVSQADTVKRQLSGGRKRLLHVSVPWKLLNVEQPKAGLRLRLDFGMYCGDKKGTWQLGWTEGRRSRSYLLLAD